MSGIDLGTVTSLPTYRVGYLPPPVGLLAAGELYVEVTPAGGGAPRLWVGTVSGSGFSGDAALILPPHDPAAPLSDITFDPIDNPAQADAVHISGLVDPGTEIELVALQGTNLDQLTPVGNWSPWDAAAGTFDMIWNLPVGDNYRIRARMRSDPQQTADSNLFAVE